MATGTDPVRAMDVQQPLYHMYQALAVFFSDSWKKKQNKNKH